MNESPAGQVGGKTSRVSLLVWAGVVSVAVIVFGAIAGLLYLRTRERGSQTSASTNAASILQADAGKPAGVPEAPVEMVDFSLSNAVSTVLGQDEFVEFNDGIRHIAREADGHTTVENLDGVPCRYLNLKPDEKNFGYLYFAMNPDFKTRELNAVRIEIEYFVRTPSFFRLQYDGMKGPAPKRYKSLVAEGGEAAGFGGTTRFSRSPAINSWQTARFHVPDGAFMNSQNGGADFRLEVTPPEIYVRRVSVTREDVQPVLPAQ